MSSQSSVPQGRELSGQASWLHWSLSSSGSPVRVLTHLTRRRWTPPPQGAEHCTEVGMEVVYGAGSCGSIPSQGLLVVSVQTHTNPTAGSAPTRAGKLLAFGEPNGSATWEQSCLKDEGRGAAVAWGQHGRGPGLLSQCHPPAHQLGSVVQSWRS